MKEIDQAIAIVRACGLTPMVPLSKATEPRLAALRENEPHCLSQEVWPGTSGHSKANIDFGEGRITVSIPGFHHQIRWID